MAEAGHILLICDDEAIASFLREKLIIDGGFAVSFASNGEEGLRAIKENSFDLILVTLGLAHDDNKELIKGLRKVDPDSIIVALVSEGESGFINEILRLGVYSVITKPLNLEKLFFLIKKGIELHMLMVTNRKLIYGLQEQNISLQKQNTLLAKRIEESTKNLSRLYEDLRSTYMRTIKVLAQAIDARDHFTHSHSQNVSRVAVVIAEEMGLSVKDIELVREACEL
ncbi:MAG: response regulator, partial [Candidatus Omnitrophica bacterium]|nr:response regulator [Candidatus Omnitrophota bacterium]